MTIEGIPEGWEAVRLDFVNDHESYLGDHGEILVHLSPKTTRFKRLIIREIEKPKQYRPFANAAEFEPHRDRWVKRRGKNDTPETMPAGCFRVTAYSDNRYWSADGVSTSYRESFDDGVCFDDGTPFGVEVQS